LKEKECCWFSINYEKESKGSENKQIISLYTNPNMYW
jgi:hypothetical protein